MHRVSISNVAWLHWPFLVDMATVYIVQLVYNSVMQASQGCAGEVTRLACYYVVEVFGCSILCCCF